MIKQIVFNKRTNMFLLVLMLTVSTLLPFNVKAYAAEANAGGFLVIGGMEGDDYVYADNVLTILSDTPLTISNEGTITDRIVVAKDIHANITLAGVDLKPQNAALEIEADSTGNVTITLADGTINTLRGYHTTAALQKNGTYSDTLGTLTIQGETNDTGILIAEGGAYDNGRYSGSAAGIGSSRNKDTANIIINSGTIVATGGNEYDTGSAAIGSGDGGNAGHIEINGGIITATGGAYSGAIGAGWDGNASDIIIRGGSIKAVPASDGHAIGDGLGNAITPTNGSEAVYPVTIRNPNNEDVYVNDVLYPYKNQVLANPDDTSLYLYLPLPTFTIKVGEKLHQGYFIDGEYHVVTDQSLVITADDGSELIYNVDYTYPDSTQILTILSEKSMTIKNADFDAATDNAIFIADGVSANLTLAGIHIVSKNPPFKIAENSKGNVTITLADHTENIICAGRGDLAGLEKNGGIDSGTLTINGNGALTATGDWNSAGIGSNGNVDTANIVINGGTIHAIGGGTGAGIGAAQRGSAGNITINGGIITAIGGTRDVNGSPVYSPGIGHGARGGSSDNIIINGGSVVAISGDNRQDSISTVPKNSNDKALSLVKIANPLGETINIDGLSYPKQHSDDDKNIYVYLTNDIHTVQIGTKESQYKNYGNGSFLPVPTAGDFIYREPVDLVYTGNITPIPDNIITGAEGMGNITVKYYLESDPDKELTNPVDAGKYIIKADASKGLKFAEIQAITDSSWTFTIHQALNEWTEDLSIPDWSFQEIANRPSAKGKFGDVSFTYSDKADGPYTNDIPVNAGTYYVKATINETANYTGLEAIIPFTIKKAIPTPEEVIGLTIVKGQALQTISLPDGFIWEDDSIIAEDIGVHQYKAIYTPNDTMNYEIVEVLFDVEVLPTLTPLNHVPAIAANDITLTAGDPFDVLKGVSAFDNEDGDLTDQLSVITNTVEPTKAGIYKVIYKVTDKDGASVTKTIQVTVNPKMAILNHVPSISATDKTLTVGDPFDVLKGVSAFDNEDGDLTDQLSVITNTVEPTKAGIYKVIYKVTDKDGASVTKTIQVTVNPKMAILNHVPSISVTDKTLTIGDPFDVLKGVSAFDAEDGDLTEKLIVVKNNVDITKAGIYEVIYKITDANGASCIKSIHITVKANIPVILKPNTDNKMPLTEANKLNTKDDQLTKKAMDHRVETGDRTDPSLYLLLLVLNGSFIFFLNNLEKKQVFKTKKS